MTRKGYEMAHDIAEMRRRAVESEAYIWLYGNTACAERMFDQSLAWSRKLTTEQRRYWAAGYWHSNEGLKLAAIHVAQIEAGERTGWRQD